MIEKIIFYMKKKYNDTSNEIEKRSARYFVSSKINQNKKFEIDHMKPKIVEIDKYISYVKMHEL